MLAMVLVFSQRVRRNKKRPTQRALDWWESARFQAVSVAWGWFRQSGVVSSAHQQVTQAVGCLVKIKGENDQLC
jgi:hypothetical protein